MHPNALDLQEYFHPISAKYLARRGWPSGAEVEEKFLFQRVVSGRESAVHGSDAGSGRLVTVF